MTSVKNVLATSLMNVLSAATILMSLIHNCCTTVIFHALVIVLTVSSNRMVDARGVI